MFSLIIPVHNRAGFLPRLFRSLDAQCLQPDETILVDNASQDGSYEICLDYAEKRKAEGVSITVLRQEKAGACAARNKGLQVARSEYVFFFDSDDEISNDFLKDIKTLIENAACPPDLVCAPAMLCFANGRAKVRDYRATDCVADQVITAMLCTQSMVMKRKWLMECGGWDENLPRWNDWELGVRLLSHKPSVEWLENKAYHRIHLHPESITGKTFSADHTHLLKAIMKAKQTIDESRLSMAEKQKSRNALAGKLLLLSAQLCRENHPLPAKTYSAQALSWVSTPLRRWAFALFHRASAFGIPGVWRWYAAFM